MCLALENFDDGEVADGAELFDGERESLGGPALYIGHGEYGPTFGFFRFALPRWPATGGLSWRIGGDNASPSLTAPLRELVVARGGLRAGAHLQIWVRGEALEGLYEVGTHDLSLGAPERTAVLELEWCP